MIIYNILIAVYSLIVRQKTETVKRAIIQLYCFNRVFVNYIIYYCL
jgi:hypothetical protein